MRCAVWMGGDDFRIEERPASEPGPGEVRVRVHACGVCMTEVHMIEGYLPVVPPPPRVLGHEWSGVVEAVGPNVAEFAVGVSVAGSGMGGFAEQTVASIERIFPLPVGAPLDAACFVEPLACCIAAVEAAGLRAGSTALVTGAGPMGQMVAQLARNAGARVLVSEPDEPRRALALRLGAEDAVNPIRESLSEAVAAFSGGAGVDAALETAGRPAPLVDCIEALREGGTAVIVGVNPTDARLELPLYRFHRRNLTLHGSYGALGAANFRAAVAQLGRVDLAPLVSHRFGLAEIAQAFDIARGGRGLKVLVDLGG